MRLYALVASLWISSFLPSEAAAAKLAPPVVYARYECLWWSSDQMRDLNPNAPPAMTTRTLLTRWEYSDPVGVPHPDVITLIVSVPEQASKGVEARIRWRGRSWSAATPLRAARSTTDGASRKLSFDIPVAEYIDIHRPRLLRSMIYIGGSRVRDVDLPIRAGD